MTMTKPVPSEKPRAGRRRAAESSARRQDIIDTAASLFAKVGYKSTTVRDIGDAAGVLSGSLYHHFDSKETILHELISGFLDEVGSRYQEIVDAGNPPEETLRELVIAAFTSLHSHRAAVTVIQNEREYLSELPRFAYLDKAERRTQRLWVSVLKEGMKDGTFRKELDADTVYRFIRDAVWVTARWFRPKGSMSQQQLADQYLSVILGGLRDGGGLSAAPAAAQAAAAELPEQPKKTTRAPRARKATSGAAQAAAAELPEQPKKTTRAPRARKATSGAAQAAAAELPEQPKKTTRAPRARKTTAAPAGG